MHGGDHGLGEGFQPVERRADLLQEVVLRSGLRLPADPAEDLGEDVAADVAGDLARAAVLGWLGARVFRVGRVRETRQVLSMVSAIRGDIPPAYAMRGLA